MANQKQVQKSMERLHGKIKKMMESERTKDFMYAGDDSRFALHVANVFGSMGQVLDDIEVITEMWEGR